LQSAKSKLDRFLCELKFHLISKNISDSYLYYKYN
jgi:hypothetical protein